MRPVIASLVWETGSQLHQVQGKVIERLGYPHRFFSYDDPLPGDADIVLIQGPYGPLHPCVQQLLSCDPARRPLLVLWFQQSLDLRLFQRFGTVPFRLFSDLCRKSPDAHWLARGLDRLLPSAMASRGRRMSWPSDILWLHRYGLLDLLVLSSSVYTEFFNGRGIPSLLIPRGYHPDYGRPLGLARDTAVVWMGKPRTSRRRHAIIWLRQQLERRGFAMQVYDGRQQGFIYGDERTRILNRTWFVLNLNFNGPSDELSIRYYVAAANGAVVLTEPNENHYPFVPGKHLVESRLEDMPDQVAHYLAHPDEWEAISSEMLGLMRCELTLERSLLAILSRVEELRQHHPRSLASATGNVHYEPFSV